MKTFNFLIFSLLFFRSLAQADFKVGVNNHYGIIMSHHDYMDHLVKGHVNAFEVNLIKPTYGDKKWQQLYKYPDLGINFIYLDLANPEVLGYTYGVSPNINFPLLKSLNNFLGVRTGAGLSYTSKKFDRIENHKNIAIGGKINFLLNIKFNYSRQLIPNFYLNMGLGITHFSNGSFDIPNLGLNIATVDAGLTYHFKKGEKTFKTDSLIAVSKKPEFSFSTFFGISEIEPPGGVKFPAYTISAVVGKHINHKGKFNFGLDVLYNSANKELMKRDSINLKNDLSNIQTGLKIGYELKLGRISFPFEMGFYVLSKFKNNGYIYHRFGLKYKLLEQVNMNLALKTHFAKADYIEAGIEYKLKN